jgi:hypothetical protein
MPIGSLNGKTLPFTRSLDALACSRKGVAGPALKSFPCRPLRIHTLLPMEISHRFCCSGCGLVHSCLLSVVLPTSLPLLDCRKQTIVSAPYLSRAMHQPCPREVDEGWRIPTGSSIPMDRAKGKTRMSQFLSWQLQKINRISTDSD